MRYAEYFTGFSLNLRCVGYSQSAVWLKICDMQDAMSQRFQATYVVQNPTIQWFAKKSGMRRTQPLSGSLESQRCRTQPVIVLLRSQRCVVCKQPAVGKKIGDTKNTTGQWIIGNAAVCRKQ